MLIGLLAGLATGALWGLTFIAPLAVEPLSAWDLTVARYEIFGLVSLCLMVSRRFRLGPVARRHLVTGLLLGGLGYTGYVAGIFFAVRLAGVAIPPLVVGTAPILLALVGNRAAASLPWRALLPPLALIAAGLLLVNASALAAAPAASRGDIAAGVACALVSLVIWIVYAIVNTGVMTAKDAPDALRWTCVQGLGAALGSLLLLPLTTIRAPGDIAALVSSPGGPRFMVWATVMGLGGSWLATWCWVVASRRLPLTLAAQLIVGETVFGLVYGFVYQGRWPRLAEGAGALLQLAGVVTAIAIFARRQARTVEARPAEATEPPEAAVEPSGSAAL